MPLSGLFVFFYYWQFQDAETFGIGCFLVCLTFLKILRLQFHYENSEDDQIIILLL